MNINVTFIIQLFNFGISCYCLHKILLKPFLDYLEQKRILKQAILESFEKKEECLKELIHAKNVALDTFKKDVYERYMTSYTSITLSELEIEAFSQKKEKIKELQKQGTYELVRRITHAYHG